MCFLESDQVDLEELSAMGMSSWCRREDGAFSPR